MTAKLAFDLTREEGDQPNCNFLIINPKDSYLIVAMDVDADKTFAFLILKRQKSHWKERDQIIYAAIFKRNFDIRGTEIGQVVSVRQMPKYTVKLSLFNERVFVLVERLDKVRYGECISICGKRLSAERILKLRRKSLKNPDKCSVIKFDRKIRP